MFKRISNLLKAFANMFVQSAERANPKMMLEQEKENLRKQIANYNQGLAAHAGLCERLMSQVKKLETEEAELRAKASANLKAGNRELAGQFALRLQTTSAQLSENRTQMEQAEKTYQELVKAREVSIGAAKKKIEDLKYAISDMEVKKATAEMMEMAGGMISSIGGSGDTLNRLEEMVNEDREKAAGRARVARDSLNTTEFTMKEAEESALADQALADFAAKEGIALDPVMPKDSGSGSKTMGAGTGETAIQ
ncbi:MAG TPA: PspA/IM30 family protein [Abditibacterium sp.]|jgi:phage shock protein A